MFCIPIQQMCVSMQEFFKHCYFFIGISLSLCPLIIWQLASRRVKPIFSRTFKINNYLSFSIFFNYLSLNLPSKATHFYIITVMDKHRTRKCQCPLGLMTHFYRSKTEVSWIIIQVSMPSRADDSFLQYPFKNLGFMRFPEPIFASICQNILTGPLFRACLKFGHI